MNPNMKRSEETFVVTIRTTPAAHKRLMDLDRKLCGTPDYMGVAFFWHHEYRHWLRDCSELRRKIVHAKLLQSGLVVSGKSAEHLAIIKKFAK
jgi:hypothetical protein